MLPWVEMMRAGLAAGVSVVDFWALSVREWRWLSHGADGHALSQNSLSDLMNDFPDKDDK